MGHVVCPMSIQRPISPALGDSGARAVSLHGLTHGPEQSVLHVLVKPSELLVFNLDAGEKEGNSQIHLSWVVLTYN